MKNTELCGQLLVGGFDGETPSSSFCAALARGERGGAVVFKRNVSTPEQALALNAALTEAFGRASVSGVPLLVAVDQEGGRVARIGAPALRVPPALTLAQLPRDQVEAVALAQSQELVAMGFTMNFAPVLDVHSRPDNPVIGDRSFGTHVEAVVRYALAYASGMRAAGLLSCGKHFPGHGDTDRDSHFVLPTVDKDERALRAVEFATFARACPLAVDSMMTAHVMFPALDDAQPATLSRRLATELLRDELGFEGVLFSDDLEMRALSGDIADNGVTALLAGCDALLVCHSEAKQDAVHARLVRECETSPAFLARCREAWLRVESLRLRFKDTSRALGPAHLAAVLAQNESLGRKLAPLSEGPLGPTVGES